MAYSLSLPSGSKASISTDSTGRITIEVETGGPVPEWIHLTRKDTTLEPIRVSGLDSRTRQRDLYELFGEYGRISSLEYRRGYADISFCDHRDAVRAIEEMNGREVDGSKLKVEWKSRCARDRRPGDRVVIFTQLPETVTRGVLETLVRRFGEITEVSVSDGVGRVGFRDSAEATEAYRSLDGYLLHGSRVLTWRPDDYIHAARHGRRVLEVSPIYPQITRDALEDIFGAFGPVDYVKFLDRSALVVMAKTHDAQKAVSAAPSPNLSVELVQ